MNKNNATFEEWSKVLLSLFTELEEGGQVDIDSYREYYNDGMTPEQALKEDLSYL
jgi:hypothetical protein